MQKKVWFGPAGPWAQTQEVEALGTVGEGQHYGPNSVLRGWGGWGGWEGEQKSLPRKLPKFLLEQNIEYNEIDHEETTSTCLKKENILFRIIKI